MPPSPRSWRENLPARAAQLVKETQVQKVDVRKRLYPSTPAQLRASSDPMIQLAAAIDEESRTLRKTAEAQDERKRQAHAAIAKARFALEGTSKYPDATFTLRLAYGPVKGFEENGRAVPFQTTYAGLYHRAESQKFKPPFDLPARWLKRKAKLDLQTPFNFVSSADIIGGNSGSPVVNRAGEFVGIIFDGNLQSLVLDFEYTDQVARAVSVHSSAILESLEKVYDAKALARELVQGRRTR